MSKPPIVSSPSSTVSPSPISPIHHTLIAAARRRPDHRLVPPERVRGRARQLLANKLVGLGLAESVAVDDGETAWWVEPDRGLVGLRLTGPAGVEAATDGDARPAEPRPWTKIARVLALLRRPEGADLRAVVAATGWLPHTARAALTGLRHKGYAIEARRDDDAGGPTGYTVYRLALLPESDSEGAR